MHFVLRREALAALPWLSERPGQLVNDAVAVPEDFDLQPNVEGKDVRGITDLANEGSWDYSFSSIK